jgi:hypothetical protein
MALLTCTSIDNGVVYLYKVYLKHAVNDSDYVVANDWIHFAGRNLDFCRHRNANKMAQMLPGLLYFS